MAKINIPFNNNNYPVDESAIASAVAALQSHLSTVMNGSGATITLGGTTYNVDSTKLATVKSDFVTHLGTISGNGAKVVVDGVEYPVDSTKLTSAITEISTVLGGLQSGDSGESDNTNDILDNTYPIEWNTKALSESSNTFLSHGGVKWIRVSALTPTVEELQQKVVRVRGMVGNYVGLDTSMGVPVAQYQAGEFSFYIIVVPTPTEYLGTIMPAGIYVNEYEGSDYDIFFGDPDASGINEYGFYFDRVYTGVLSSGEEQGDVILVFYADGSANLLFYQNGSYVMGNAIPAGNLVYEDHKISDLSDGTTYDVSEDGTQITSPGFTTLTLTDASKLFLPTITETTVFNEANQIYIMPFRIAAEETLALWSNLSIDTVCVDFDGVTYECALQTVHNGTAVGNCTAFGGTSNGEPFMVQIGPDGAPDITTGICIVSVPADTEPTEHTIRVYQKASIGGPEVTDILDDTQPIEWNTKTVSENNSSFTLSGIQYVKVSNLVLTDDELNTKTFSVVREDGTVLNVSSVIPGQINGWLALTSRTAAYQCSILVVPEASELDGASISAGTYAKDMYASKGTEDTISVIDKA